jgi:hypothetical protein
METLYRNKSALYVTIDVMPDVLAMLIEERDRLNLAIAALQSGVRRRGRPPGSGASAAAKPAKRPGRKKMSSAARKAVSERMKKYWAGRKKGKK